MPRWRMPRHFAQSYPSFESTRDSKVGLPGNNHPGELPTRGCMARTRTKSGKKQGENQKTRDSEGESPTSPQLEPLVPPAPWSDIALPVQSRSREDFRIPVSRATVRTDPGILPEVPKESRGLFEMVSPTARRALELGLAAKEPSFHVFVAAEPEVMIEDDLVRYAERFARARGWRRRSSSGCG